MNDAERITAQAVDLCIEIHEILIQAYGGNLDGSERGPLVSSYYLARIRDRLRGYTPVRPPPICASCIDLRGRLLNVYHLTLTYRDPVATLRTIRAASGPGAPAPGAESDDPRDREEHAIDCPGCAARSSNA